VLGFFGLLEGALRAVGLRPPARPRLIVRSIDTDIDLPFMRLDEDLFWSPMPGFRGDVRGWPVSINSLGLRGPEVEIPKPARSRRVVCLGDSITFGYGVGDEDTYPHLLGRALAGGGIDVVNAGVTGYTSGQVLKLARRLLPRVGADVATLCIGWNDGNLRPVSDREYARRLKAAAAVEGTAGRLYVFRALQRLYVGRHPPGARQARTTPRVGLAEYRSNLAGIVRECVASGARPAFVALPHRRRAGEAPVRSPYAEALAEVARELGVPVLGPVELRTDTPLESNEDNFIDSLHLSPRGAALMARHLAEQLAALGWVPQPGS
jgi:lysophospholipase L1-like esterase